MMAFLDGLWRIVATVMTLGIGVVFTFMVWFITVFFVRVLLPGIKWTAP